MFALSLAEEKIEPEVVANIRTWPPSGLGVDQSVFLPPVDRALGQVAAAANGSLNNSWRLRRAIKRPFNATALGVPRSHTFSGNGA